MKGDWFLSLAACGEEPVPDTETEIAATDPLLARALADPLMSDPDLAHRNEANAAVTVRFDHALPPLVATRELADRARDAARVELLAGGSIPDLPNPSEDDPPARLTAIETAADMVDAVGGPRACIGQLRSGLRWAADLPDPARIMPHAMVQQAAGVENAGCSLRVVRYLIPVGMEDVLHYHYALAGRAQLEPAYYRDAEGALVGASGTEALVVQARPGPAGLSAVDLIYWTK